MQEIILTAGVDTTNVTSQMEIVKNKLGELTTATKLLRTENIANNKELVEAQKQAAAGNENAKLKVQELGKAISGNNIEIKKNTEEQQKYNKELKGLDAANGSLRQMQLEVAKLQNEYATLSKIEREGVAGEGLKGRIAGLNAEVLKVEQSIGKSQRQVGDYSVALRELFGGSFAGADQLVSKIEAISTLVQGFAKTGVNVAQTASTTAATVALEAEAIAAGQAAIALDGVAVSGGAAAVANEAVAVTGAEAAVASGGILGNLGGVAALGGTAFAAPIAGLLAVGAGLAFAAKNSVPYRDALLEVSKNTGIGIEKLNEYAKASAQIDLPNGDKIISKYQDITTLQKEVLSIDPAAVTDNIALLNETKSAILLNQADAELNLKDAAIKQGAILESFGISGQKSLEVANKLSGGTIVGTQTISQAVDGILKAAPAAKAANASFDELNVIIQKYAISAGGANEAGTSLRNVLNKLSTTDMLSPEGMTQLKVAGVDLGLLYDKSKPLEDRLKALSGVKYEQISKVFGETDGAIVQGLLSFSNKTKGAEDSLGGLIAKANEADLILNQAAKNQEKAGAAWENIGNRISNAFTSVEFADTLSKISLFVADAINAALDFSGGFIDAFSSVFNDVEKIFDNIAKLVQPAIEAFSQFFGETLKGVNISEMLGYVIGTVVTVPLRLFFGIISTGVDVIVWFATNIKALYKTLTESNAFIALSGAIGGVIEKLKGLTDVLPFAASLTGGFANEQDKAAKATDRANSSLSFYTTGLRAMSQELLKVTGAAAAQQQAMDKATGSAQTQGDQLKKLKTDLLAAQQAYASLKPNEQAGATGNALRQQAQAIQKQIDDITGIGKMPRATASEKTQLKGAEKEKSLVAGSLDAVQSEVSKLDKQLQNTKIGSTAFNDLNTRLQAAKARLLELKAQFDDLTKTPQQKALEAAKDAKGTRDVAINKEGTENEDAAKVVKLRLLESERQYQFEVLQLTKEGTKEREAAELSLAKSEKDISDETRKLIEQDAKETIDIEKKKAEERKKITDKFVSDSKAVLDDGLMQQKQSIELDYANGVTTDEEHKRQLLAAEIKYWKEVSSIAGLGAKEKADAVKKVSELENKQILDDAQRAKLNALKEQKTLMDNVKKLGSDVLNIGKDFVTAETNERLGKLEEQHQRELAAAGDNAEKKSQIDKKYAAEKDAINKEQAEKQKAIAIGQAIINGALAVTTILAQAPKFDGGILTAIMIAGAVATTLGQIAVIESRKYRKGGVIQGAAHEGGGVKGYIKGHDIELEGDEVVLNKQSMSNKPLLNIASFVNEQGGGVSFGESIPTHLKRAIVDYSRGKAFNYPVPSNAVLSVVNGQGGQVAALLSENNRLAAENNRYQYQIERNTRKQNTHLNLF